MKFSGKNHEIFPAFLCDSLKFCYSFMQNDSTEYIGALLEEVTDRPIYIVREERNQEEEFIDEKEVERTRGEKSN